jgi:hypothetical protein
MTLVTDEKAQIEIEWLGSHIDPDHDQMTLELWKDVWRDCCRHRLDAAD